MFSLSIIIPCKNEEKFIAICIDALFKQKYKKAKFEIIVVDNGSTDRTLEILEDYKSKIKVLCLPNVSISELRNHGAVMAKGEWLAFIDADVEVDDVWYTNFVDTIQKLKKEGRDVSKVITGSTYLISETPTWVEHVWFNQLLARDRENDSYINGGNLIVNQIMFNEIGGFNPNYTTGEDVKFCHDTLMHGGIIIRENAISVIHHGYPKTVKQFFRRERWHGVGMSQYILQPWKSKDLLLALYFVFIIICLPFSLNYSSNSLFLLTIIFLMFFLPLFLLALKRYNSDFNILFPLTFLYFIYGWARVFSLIDIILNSTHRKHKS